VRSQQDRSHADREADVETISRDKTPDNMPVKLRIRRHLTLGSSHLVICVSCLLSTAHYTGVCPTPKFHATGCHSNV
jgi:hypothetical protein